MPKSLDEILDRGQELEEKEEWENAHSLYVEGIKLYPQNIDLLFRTAHVEEVQGNRDEAIKIWERVIMLNPNDSGSYAKLAELYYDVDKYKYYMTRAKLRVTEEKPTHAISDLKKAVEASPDDKATLEALFLLGQMYIQVGKPQQAIEEFVKMLQIEDNINVYMILSQLYEEEDPDMAIDTLKQGIEKFPEAKVLQERLAILYSQQNNPENALEYAQSPNAKAKAYLQQGDNEKAFEEINKITVKDYSYHSLLSEYYFNTKKYDECLQTISTLEKMNALNPIPYQMKALVYEERNDNYNAFYNWGKCYELQGKSEMALAEYLNAYHEDEKNPAAISHIVNLYEILDEKYSALEFLQKLIEIEPNNETMLKKLSNYYMKEGNTEEAIEILEKCVSNGTKDYVIYGTLANFYDKNKRFAKALKAYEKYIEIAPVSNDTEFVKSRIDKLREMDIKEEAEPTEEEGFFDKLINLFKKNK